MYFRSKSYTRCPTLFHLMLFWKRNVRFLTCRCLVTMSVYLLAFWKVYWERNNYFSRLQFLSFSIHFYTINICLFYLSWILAYDIYRGWEDISAVVVVFFCIGSFIGFRITSQVEYKLSIPTKSWSFMFKRDIYHGRLSLPYKENWCCPSLSLSLLLMHTQYKTYTFYFSSNFHSHVLWAVYTFKLSAHQAL